MMVTLNQSKSTETEIANRKNLIILVEHSQEYSIVLNIEL